MSLQPFPLPLPMSGPPNGFNWNDAEMSITSNTTAFRTGINQRDRLGGQRRCVVCGIFSPERIQHCHIIMESEPYTWEKLKEYHWLPHTTKASPAHEPRNGLTLCANHHLAFDHYSFFIRYIPTTKKFVFVNYSGDPSNDLFHGKAIALDIKERYAPFPSVFIIQEQRVRGFHPFQPTGSTFNEDPPWQDWILNEGLLNSQAGSSSFFHETVGGGSSHAHVQGQFQPHPQPFTNISGDNQDGLITIGPLDADAIKAIISATQAMPSWRACEMENMSWNGTANENIEKYISSFGTNETT